MGRAMRMTEEFKRDVYVAKHSVNNNVHVFDEPVRYSVNYKPTISRADIIALGERHSDYLRIITDLNTGANFDKLDRVYVNSTPPPVHDKLAQGADYVVYSVIQLQGTTQVLLRKANVDYGDNTSL